MVFEVFLLLIGCHCASSDEFEIALIKMLMNEYNPLERPVENKSLPDVVKLGIDLQQIMDLVSFLCI